MSVLACVDIFPIERIVPVVVTAVMLAGVTVAGLAGLVVTLFRRNRPVVSPADPAEAPRP